MATDADLDFDEHDDDNDSQGDTPAIRQLRQRHKELADKAKQAEERAAAAEERLRERDFRDATATLNLNDRQRAALRREWEQDGSDPDKLRPLAVEMGYAPAEFDEATAERQAHERLERTSTGATPSGSGLISGSDYASWPTAQRDRFRRDHPDKFAALKRGEKVPL